jgi:hypothetical protein
MHSPSAERGSTSPDVESAVEQSDSLLLSWLTCLASCAPLYAPMNVMPVLLLALMMVIHMVWLFGLVALAFGVALWMGRQ